MSLSRTSSLFFDASCLILAANTAQGGSAFLLAVCGRRFLQAVTSPDAVAEAERNLLAKFPSAAFTRLQTVLQTSGFVFVDPPSPSAIDQYESMFVEDAHIVAAAMAANADYLISVDKPLLARVADTGLSLTALSPGAFLQSVFPAHPDYAAIRREVR